MAHQTSNGVILSAMHLWLVVCPVILQSDTATDAVFTAASVDWCDTSSATLLAAQAALSWGEQAAVAGGTAPLRPMPRFSVNPAGPSPAAPATILAILSSTGSESPDPAAAPLLPGHVPAPHRPADTLRVTRLANGAALRAVVDSPIGLAYRLVCPVNTAADVEFDGGTVDFSFATAQASVLQVRLRDQSAIETPYPRLIRGHISRGTRHHLFYEISIASSSWPLRRSTTPYLLRCQGLLQANAREASEFLHLPPELVTDTGIALQASSSAP
jgi:hypothetical protein